MITRYRNSHENKYVGELFQRYTHLVYAVCLKYLKQEDDSKDAVMEIFEKIMLELKRHDIQNFKGWLHSVAKNHCLMHLRKEQSELKKVEEFKKVEDGFVELELPAHLNNNHSKEQQLNELQLAIGQLKPEQKECVELFYLREKCYQEVAEITGYSLKQVKSYIQNGKRNLKINMSTMQDE